MACRAVLWAYRVNSTRARVFPPWLGNFFPPTSFEHDSFSYCYCHCHWVTGSQQASQDLNLESHLPPFPFWAGQVRTEWKETPQGCHLLSLQKGSLQGLRRGWDWQEPFSSLEPGHWAGPCCCCCCCCYCKYMCFQFTFCARSAVANPAIWCFQFSFCKPHFPQETWLGQYWILFF